MKLSKEVVQRRVTLLAEEGIEFKTNINVGKDISAKVEYTVYFLRTNYLGNSAKYPVPVFICLGTSRRIRCGNPMYRSDVAS